MENTKKTKQSVKRQERLALYVLVFVFNVFMNYVREKQEITRPKKTENMGKNERKHANHKGSMSAPLLSF